MEQDKKLIKSEKEQVKEALTALPEFNVWTVQFHKTHYTVNVKHNKHWLNGVQILFAPNIPVNNYANLTSEQQTRLEKMIEGLNLHYPVKIIGGGPKY
jgi:hypothetical protein